MEYSISTGCSLDISNWLSLIHLCSTAYLYLDGCVITIVKIQKPYVWFMLLKIIVKIPFLNWSALYQLLNMLNILQLWIKRQKVLISFISYESLLQLYTFRACDNRLLRGIIDIWKTLIRLIITSNNLIQNYQYFITCDFHVQLIVFSYKILILSPSYSLYTCIHVDWWIILYSLVSDYTDLPNL